MYDEKWFWGLVIRRGAKACSDLGIHQQSFKAYLRSFVISFTLATSRAQNQRDEAGKKKRRKDVEMSFVQRSVMVNRNMKQVDILRLKAGGEKASDELMMEILTQNNSSILQILKKECKLQKGIQRLTIVSKEHNEKEEESEDETDFYFYANQTDASSLVTEYIAPHEDWNGTFPDFIYSPDQVKGIRIVEFYAHWCPHCQHFRSHYIQFAKQTKNLLREYSPETTLNTFAISCVPWKPICQDMDIKGYPTLIIFQDGSVNGTVLHYYELHPFKILSMLGIQYTEESALLVDQEAKESSSFVRKTPNRQPSRDAFFLPRTKKEIYDDAHLSFDFAMRNALFLDKEKPLYNETSRTLRDWIDQLKDALPPTIGSLKTLVSEISESMEDILRANGNGGEAMIKSILDRYPPKRKTWSYSCTRGDKYAGYTCGLWELFHIMTVGLVEWNYFSNGDDWSYYRVSQAAKVLRDYVEYFFGCEVCKVNFLHAFDSCEYDRCNRFVRGIGEPNDWMELPIWLFESHNGVNRRLIREKAKRDGKPTPTLEEERAVQWPSKDECPKCWHQDGRWDPDNIFKFLRITYWPADSVSAEMRQELFSSSSLQDDDDVDSDNHDGATAKFLFMFGCIALVAYITSWHRKQNQLRKSGYHKKVDERG